MDGLNEIAIANLSQHCEAVLAAHGSPTRRTSSMTLNDHDIPIPYPNLVTTGSPDLAETHYSQIESFLESRPKHQPVGVVDSFSNLDLTRFGLSKMFSDPWFLKRPTRVEMAPPSDLSIDRVTTPRELAEFERASSAGFGDEGSVQAYLPALLEDPRYRFYLGRFDDRPDSGVAAFNSGDAVGIYSLFTLPDVRGKGFGSAMVRSALADSDPLAAVTNPSGMSRGIFEAAGFAKIGTRTIWTRSGGP